MLWGWIDLQNAIQSFCIASSDLLALSNVSIFKQPFISVNCSPVGFLWIGMVRLLVGGPVLKPQIDIIRKRIKKKQLKSDLLFGNIKLDPWQFSSFFFNTFISPFVSFVFYSFIFWYFSFHFSYNFAHKNIFRIPWYMSFPWICSRTPQHYCFCSSFYKPSAWPPRSDRCCFEVAFSEL